MTVMFLIRSLEWYGGAQRQLANLAKGMARGGHEVVVVTYYPYAPLEQELKAAGVTVCSLEKRGRWDLWGPTAKLVRLVRKTRPSVVHGYLSTANIFSLVAKLCRPSVKIVWGMRASNMQWERYDWLHQFSFACERRLSGCADLLLVNSYAGRDHHAASGFPVDQMQVVHNGIDTDRFRPDKEAGRRLKRQWGIGEGERVICMVGRLDPMKDHPTFLRAAARIAQQRPEVRFVCVGRGSKDYTDALHTLATELGIAERLLWPDCVVDMVPVYNASDVVVLPSSWGEGFPNVLGEAIACGIPCVATDVGDSARIVAESAGKVVPPSDAHALADAVLTVMAENGRYQPAALHEMAVQSFGQQRMIQATEEQLRRLICH
jgi:glycosyltransferase involved in cell wall biosynthesis